MRLDDRAFVSRPLRGSWRTNRVIMTPFSPTARQRMAISPPPLEHEDDTAEVLEAASYSPRARASDMQLGLA